MNTIKARLGLPLVLALSLFALVAAPAGAGAAKPKYEVYASCANGKPFEAADHCSYDARDYFRATFVFESHVGKKPVKACFRIYGPKPLGGGHACAKLDPLAFKAYPFKITGVTQHFSVKVTWYVKKKPGAGFSAVGSSFMKVVP